MNEHEDNLRDLAAMFAMMGLLTTWKKLPDDLREIPEHAYQLANAFMEVRADEALDREAEGIASIKPKRAPK
jgi:TRAP-type mannitol/chloroaromatic compound transport system substrate-binding protein